VRTASLPRVRAARGRLQCQAGRQQSQASVSVPAGGEGVVADTGGGGGGVPLPAAAFAGALALAAFQKIRSRSGSLRDLEERGALDKNRHVDEDAFYRGMMKNVRTVQTPELSADQISAARARRAQARSDDVSPEQLLDEVDLPANHPFAVKEELPEGADDRRREQMAAINRPRRRRGQAPPAN